MCVVPATRVEAGGSYTVRLQVGVASQQLAWIPACAGMTESNPAGFAKFIMSARLTKTD